MVRSFSLFTAAHRDGAFARSEKCGYWSLVGVVRVLLYLLFNINRVKSQKRVSMLVVCREARATNTNTTTIHQSGARRREELGSPHALAQSQSQNSIPIHPSIVGAAAKVTDQYPTGSGSIKNNLSDRWFGVVPDRLLLCFKKWMIAKFWEVVLCVGQGSEQLDSVNDIIV